MRRDWERITAMRIIGCELLKNTMDSASIIMLVSMIYKAGYSLIK